MSVSFVEKDDIRQLKKRMYVPEFEDTFICITDKDFVGRNKRHVSEMRGN